MLDFLPMRKRIIGCLCLVLCQTVTAQTRQLAPIRLSVDATDAPRKIFHAREVIPASPGALTLLYPKWIPGEHGPTGPIINLAGMRFTAAGKALPWRRDDADMFAFHIDVPAGATSVEAALDFLSPAGVEGFSSSSSATAEITVMCWT